MSTQTSENVQVAVRVRPFNDREKGLESTSCIRMVKETQQTIITDPETGTEKAFTFDFSYNSFLPPDDPEFASQDTVWEDLGVKVLEHAWQGFNVSLFAYGQTGSGKSFSMVGYGSEKGIIPRACEVIFERIDANDSDIVFKVEASMMEIYNERVKDLFNPVSDNLKIRDHPRQGPYAEGLTRSAVSSYAEISRMMDAGILARTTASTNMNATSSRAHTIFQIIVTQSRMDPTTNKLMDKVSRINLIDLAGSERAASTGATGARLKEGAAINQSLSALGNCISALADIANGKKKQVVPYRNSKLTHLLKDSLGGNAKTIMIAALSPASVNYSETLGTLRYADRAKQIKNQAVINEDPNQMLIRQLKEELEMLKRSMIDNIGFRPVTRAGGTDRYMDANGDFFAERPQLDEEKEKELAMIREQLEEHQRLLKESEKSWQERLRETEELARKREEQLKMLGLVTNAEALKQRSMTEPHLINLNEDQQMSEKLLFFLQQGKNKIGRIDAEEEQNIVIGGLGILKEHAIISREPRPPVSERSNTGEEIDIDTDRSKEAGDKIILSPVTLSKVFVNGQPVREDQPIVLRHCDRVIFGVSNVFRVVIPWERAIVNEEAENTINIAKESQFDWQYAMKEFNRVQLQVSQETEAKAEKEKQEMDARMKKMEERMQIEQKSAEEKLAKQREEWEKHVQLLTEQMKQKEDLIKKQMMSEGDMSQKNLAEQLALQESKLAKELVKAEISFEKKQMELVHKQKELENSLQNQMREAKLLSEQKERERMERMRFDDVLLQSIPIVNEANSMAEELKRDTYFVIKLITSGPTPMVLSNQEADAAIIAQGIFTDLKVQVNFQESGTYRSVMWDIEKFKDNVYLMREMYQVFIENNRVWNPKLWKQEDPFYDPPSPQLIGNAFVFMRNLIYGGKVIENTSIYDYKGTPNGSLRCEITPTIASHEWQAVQNRLVEIEDVRALILPSLVDFLNTTMHIEILIPNLKGIPGKLCKDIYIEFKWELDNNHPMVYKTPVTAVPSVDPVINYTAEIDCVITRELIEYLTNYPLEFSVYGIVPSSNLNKVQHRAVGADKEEEEEKKTLGNKKRSSRRRHGKMITDEEDSKVLIEKYVDQLAVQEKTLIENTQELETKIQELEELRKRLQDERQEKEQIKDTLEETLRTNKILQGKLEQQIIKDNVLKLASPDRRASIRGILLGEGAPPKSPSKSAQPVDFQPRGSSQSPGATTAPNPSISSTSGVDLALSQADNLLQTTGRQPEEEQLSLKSREKAAVYAVLSTTKPPKGRKGSCPVS